jgi:RNA polymerase sigma factor (sigma-70 family)
MHLIFQLQGRDVACMENSRRIRTLKIATKRVKEMRPNDEAPGNEVEKKRIERQNLAVQYMPLAYKIAGSFAKNWSWMRDELESEAMVALVEAANNYDPAFNTKFTTYARIRITGALTTFRTRMMQSVSETENSSEDGETLEQKKVWRHTKPTSNLSLDEVNNYLQKCNNASYHARTEENLAMMEELQEYIKRLPRRHRAVISAFYIESSEVEDVARRCRCSVTRLRAIHREAVNMLLSGDLIPKVSRARMKRCVPFQSGLPSRGSNQDRIESEN